MIYLDYAATTPISEAALEVYTKVARQYFGNASSLHDLGSASRQILDASSKTIARTLNARDRDIYFTSGASESNFLAIYSLLEAMEKKGGHIITTQIEHSSISNIFNKLEMDGYEITRLGVDQYGQIDFDELQGAVRNDTVLASIQHVNSEIGTIQDLSEIGAFLHEHKVIVHSDCVQSYGKIPLDVQELNIDALSISAHKIYGPKGVGAVWINPKAEWKPVFPGMSSGKGLKPGTSNIPAIASFATAAKEIHEDREDEQQRMQTLRDEFLPALKDTGFEFKVEAHPQKYVPNILGLRFPGMEGQFLMLECNQAGLAISTGSACQVGSDQPNTTMTALGKNEQEAREFIRLSFGKQNSLDQVSLIIEKMSTILTRHFDKVNHNRIKEETTP
ncbi:MAG: IscS subfamily cysteine desulfurase [Balneolaceae bacterium]